MKRQGNYRRNGVKTIDNYRLATWEKLGKQLIWAQLDFVHGMKVLDFGSGTGVTADFFSEDNEVIAVEPSEKMVKDGETEILFAGEPTHSEGEPSGFMQIIGGIDGGESYVGISL